MNKLKEIREKALVNVKEVVEQNEQKIKEAYEWIMRFAYKARKEGLLALEYDANYIPKDMPLCNHITEMVERVCNGTEPELLAELMTVRFMSNDYTGLSALLFYVYTRCMLMIQEGLNPLLIEDFLNCIVSGTHLVFNKKHNMWEEEKKHNIEKWKNGLTEKEREYLRNISVRLQDLSEDEWKIVVSCNGVYGFDKVIPFLDEDVQFMVKSYMNEYRYYSIMRMPELVQEQELSELEEELEKFIVYLREKKDSNGILEIILTRSDNDIQKLLRNIDNATLTIALKGAKEEVTEAFFRNLSPRLKYMIQEDMEFMGPLRMSDIEEAQNKILLILKDSFGL